MLTTQPSAQVAVVQDTQELGMHATEILCMMQRVCDWMNYRFGMTTLSPRLWTIVVELPQPGRTVVACMETRVLDHFSHVAQLPAEVEGETERNGT